MGVWRHIGLHLVLKTDSYRLTVFYRFWFWHYRLQNTRLPLDTNFQPHWTSFSLKDRLLSTFHQNVRVHVHVRVTVFEKFVSMSMSVSRFSNFPCPCPRPCPWRGHGHRCPFSSCPCPPTSAVNIFYLVSTEFSIKNAVEICKNYLSTISRSRDFNILVNKDC